MCGDEKWYHYPPSAILCRYCSNTVRKEEALEGCKRTCIDCHKESYLKTPSAVVASPRCRSCSAKHRAKTTPMPEHKVRYLRVCPECEDEKFVASEANCGIKLCRKCTNKESAKAKRPNTKGVTKRKYVRKKTYTPVGTDGAKRNKVTVKFQVVDPETMEAPVKKREVKVLPQLDENDSLKMQEEFLKRRNLNDS